MRANGQLGGDLSALLGGVLAVDAWRAGPMPTYGRQMGHAAITGHGEARRGVLQQHSDQANLFRHPRRLEVL